MNNGKPTFIITLPFSTVKVTNEDIDDIMDTAMAGCTHWCLKAKVIGEYLGKSASDQISRQGALEFYPEGDKSVILTKVKFREGLYKWLLSLEDETSVMDGKRIDPGAIDADAADSILQYALFGELVYS